MPLSAEMREFFDKVAKKNFCLACDVYHALATGKEINKAQPASQGTRGIASFMLMWGATKKEEPAHSCAGFFSDVYRSALLDYSSNISTATIRVSGGCVLTLWGGEY